MGGGYAEFFDGVRHGGTGFASANYVNFANRAKRIARTPGNENAIAQPKMPPDGSAGSGRGQSGAENGERLPPQLALDFHGDVHADLHNNAGGLRVPCTRVSESAGSLIE